MIITEALSLISFVILWVPRGSTSPQTETHPAKHSAKTQRLGMNAVQFPFGLFCPFSGRADEAVELKPSGHANAEYAPKGTALGWKGKRKVCGKGKRRMEEKHEIESR